MHLENPATRDFQVLSMQYAERKVNFLVIDQAWEGGAFLNRKGLFDFIHAAAHALPADRPGFEALWKRVRTTLTPVLAQAAIGPLIRYKSDLTLRWADGLLRDGTLLDPDMLPLWFHSRANVGEEKALAKCWLRWDRAGFIKSGWQTHSKIMDVVRDECATLRSGVLLTAFFACGVPLENSEGQGWPVVWATTHNFTLEGWLASHPDTKSVIYRMLDAYLVAGGEIAGVDESRARALDIRRAEHQAGMLDSGKTVKPVLRSLARM